MSNTSLPKAADAANAAGQPEAEAASTSSGTYPSTADLVDAMNGVPSTNQWDVVCSYSAELLNQFLAAQYDANKLTTEVSLTTDRSDPLSGSSYTINYDVQFGSPKLSFVADRPGVAQLAMPITSGLYSVTPKDASQATSTTSIPADTYTVTTVVPLASMDGTSGAVTTPGNVVDFGDDGVNHQQIVLQFQNSGGTTFAIDPAPTEADTDALVTYFLPILAQYFQTQVSEIDYTLVTVNNKASTEGTVLTPKSFTFASTGSGDTGVLSLYIQTANSGNPPGNLSPSFQPNDTQMLPIADGHTASIILSNSLVKNGFLVPQLATNGFAVNFNTPSDGISAELKSSAAVVNPGENNDWIFGGRHYGGLDLNLNDHPLTLTFHQGSLSLQWNASTTSSWDQIESDGESAAAQYGTVDLSITVNTTPTPIAAENKDLSIASVSLQRSDFAIETNGHKCSIGDILLGCEESVPAYYGETMTLQIAPITVALTGLDFFATTNVLAPGQQIIQIDKSAGTQTPHDFLLLGNVITAES